MADAEEKPTGRRPPLRADFYPIWSLNTDVRHQIIRFICTFFTLAVTLYCTCMLSVVADSFYVPEEQPPLPDRLHDQILHRRAMPSWLPHLVDGCTMIVVFGSGFGFFLLLPFPLNLQVSSRFATLVILGLWMRSAAILMTTVPPSKLHCVPQMPKNTWELLTAAFRQATNHNQECAGMIISGHSLNMMHGIMCMLFYGRARCSLEKRGKRQGFCCRDVDCCCSRSGQQQHPPHYALKGCFLHQCCSFLKQWLQLRSSGADHPAATAAARCFPPVPVEYSCSSSSSSKEGRQTGGQRHLKNLLLAVARLPLLRYLCYAAAITGWITIPVCYNHYLVDVFFALLLSVLWWFVYHLIVTIQIVQKRGARGGRDRSAAPIADAGSDKGPSVYPSEGSAAALPDGDWQLEDLGGGGPSSGRGNRAGAPSSPPAELEGCSEKRGRAEEEAVDLHVDLCMQRETTPGSEPSDVGRGQEVTQGTALGRADSNAQLRAAAYEEAFAAEFEALNLSWILDFPILKPISWCIRKLEGLSEAHLQALRGYTLLHSRASVRRANGADGKKGANLLISRDLRIPVDGCSEETAFSDLLRKMQLSSCFSGGASKSIGFWQIAAAATWHQVVPVHGTTTAKLDCNFKLTVADRQNSPDLLNEFEAITPRFCVILSLKLR
ncbi:hypothetical protein Efla_006668 [Eimeria flavescens]